MKPAPLGYARAESLGHLFRLWKAAGEEARLIAGGQSLVASLNLRFAGAPALIDINRVEGISDIVEAGDVVLIGALARHRDLAVSQLLARHVPLLPRAAHLIAHPAIRTRGTIGGSLAYADPAAELPACMVALDATLLLRSEAGSRRVPARDFFHGLFETALQPFEMIEAVEVRKRPAGTRQHILELTRRSGDYAIVGLAAVEPERGLAPDLVFFGIGDAPVLARRATAALSESGKAAAVEALADDIDPPDDMNGSAAFKRHLAGVLLGRMLQAIEDDEDGEAH